MDLMSVLGIILSFLMILFGILWTDSGIMTANLSNFWDFNSVIVTIGGTITALMIAFPLDFFKEIPKHMKILFFPTSYKPNEYIDQIVELATTSRMNGLLSLENKVEELDDPFFKSSVNLIVDSADIEKNRNLLETELDNLDERHAQARAFYDKGAAFGPAFGMLGTLMGLINLLKELDDVSKVAPAMALALVTTFYGTILSNIIFLPISNKLRVRHEEEYLCKRIIAEGVLSIQIGENPRFIGEKLSQLLTGRVARKVGVVGQAAPSGSGRKLGFNKAKAS